MNNTRLQLKVTLAILAVVLGLAIAATPGSALAADRGEPVLPGAAPAAYGCTYHVRPSDTLFSIALRHNTTVQALAAANGLSNPNLIYAGMALSVPCPDAAPGGTPSPAAGTCDYHIVARGEYLSLIAARYRTTWHVLAQFNRLVNPNLIFAGTRLAIPCSGTPPSAGQWKTFTSTRYDYTVNYPAAWSVQVNTTIPSGADANPEFVKLALDDSSLPQVEIDAMTGTPPFSGYEDCTRNFVFRGLPVCKISVPGGQIPATDIWVFQKGGAHFRIALVYKDAQSAQVFDDVMRSFQFTR
jgi:LysM repeat protein